MFLFNRQGDSLAAKLRTANGPSAEGWEAWRLPGIEGPQPHGKELALRGEALVVERDRLPLGESLATLSMAEDAGKLVADELAAALSQNRVK